MRTYLMKIVWVFALAAGLLSTQLQAKNSEKSEKVDICHFSGHQSDGAEPVSDFIIDERGSPAIDCDDLGGDVISISENALKAHGADGDTGGGGGGGGTGPV